MAVYCAAVAAGDAAEWDFGWSRLQEATVANEASALMAALACTGDAHLLQRWVFLVSDDLEESAVTMTTILNPESLTSSRGSHPPVPGRVQYLVPQQRA